ncbi:MAG: ATP-binding cassette domain-containing protein [Gammaproteobacteria bacterium]|nr:ATP-binding cassette domain-containing protein [Gammaproteobacteria bacterium]
MLLRLDNQDLGYDRHTVLHGVSLTINAGDRIALVGESGAGKSTLLAAIQGRLLERAALVPQSPGLVDSLSVFHNIYMGQLNRHPTWYNLLNLAWPRRQEIATIQPLAARLGLEEKLFERAGELSGGQQQRVGVCRALHQGGALVLGDEPVSAVDNHQARTVLDALQEYFNTVVLAMHDVELALQYASRIIGLKQGVIAFDQPSAGLAVSDLDFLYRERDEPRH